MTTMECVFEKKIFTSSELLRMQEFWTFTNKIHEMAKCKEADCDFDKFLKKKQKMFFLMKN